MDPTYETAEITVEIFQQWSTILSTEEKLRQMGVVLFLLDRKPIEKSYRIYLECLGIDLTDSDDIAEVKKWTAILVGAGIIEIREQWADSVLDLENPLYFDNMVDEEMHVLKEKLEEDAKILEMIYNNIVE